MPRVDKPSSDAEQYLQYAAKMSYVLPSYMFTPPHRQHGYFYKSIASEAAQDTQNLLRVNMLFKWLCGDFGPIDDAFISKTDMEDLYRDMWISRGVLFSGLMHNERVIIGKELKFWDHVLNGDKRRKPLKIKEPFKYPVMNERFEEPWTIQTARANTLSAHTTCIERDNLDDEVHNAITRRLF